MAAAHTIPELFDRALARDPDKDWLLFEDERFTYAEAAARIGAIAAALAGEGIGKGDRVLATARNEPAYLFCWLAVVRLGAIFVPANPNGSAQELDGLAAQTEPRLIVGDAEARELAAAPAADPPPAAAEPGDPAVLIPTSGTTGRSKLVTQTHRAYAWAGEGFPFWMRLSRGRPADDVAAALPHQRAGVLDARLGRRPARASCCCRASRPAASSTPRAATARPSSTRSARCSRS